MCANRYAGSVIRSLAHQPQSTTVEPVEEASVNSAPLTPCPSHRGAGGTSLSACVIPATLAPPLTVTENTLKKHTAKMDATMKLLLRARNLE